MNYLNLKSEPEHYKFNIIIIYVINILVLLICLYLVIRLATIKLNLKGRGKVKENEVSPREHDQSSKMQQSSSALEYIIYIHGMKVGDII